MHRDMVELTGVLTAVGDSGNRVDWDAVAASYGLDFPSDYKEFVSFYGEGEIGPGITVQIPGVSPGRLWPGVDRLPEMTRRSFSAKEWKDPESARLYSVDDFLVWGAADDGDVLCWITRGDDPAAWPVAVFSRSEASWAVLPPGMVKTLLGILRADAGECPLSNERLWGAGRATFLHARESRRRQDAGLDPWTGQPDPYAGEFD
ncbi:hypothetical protein ACIGHB_00645 [Streptomyces sp. NPDC085460]|uniref:hypothetical protein n=1 Tax=Streptomyces sp. NPDC085460 TaxID=3365723 RepID=UPI0037D8F266